jgi:glycosyltransferase involved in cell wall biosynthesis
VRIGLVVAGGVDRSGRERVLPELLDFITRIAARHEMHVFVLQYYAEPCDYDLLGARVHDLGRVDRPRGLRLWRLERRLRHALRMAGRFDVLHAYWGMPTGALTVRIGRSLATPVVVTLTTGELVAIDDIEYGLQRTARDRFAVDLILQHAAQVTVPTEYMRQLAAARADRVVVIPMGLNRDRFSASVVANGPPWRLLRVATMNRVKDYPLLIEAFARVLVAEPDTTLDVVGEDVLDGAVQSLVQQRSIAERVTFHGYLPTDRLPALYARAHLHVVSSRHEASSVTTIEASLAGVATVGTPVGHLADWSAFDPPGAVAVRPGDAQALADGIIALLRDPARRQRVAAVARTWALEHDADWTASAFDALYARVAAGSR